MSDYLNLPGNEPGNLSVNLHQDTFEWALQKTYDFARLMSCYRCAMMEIETKLNVLNEEFPLRFDRQPISSIRTRLKNPLSIHEKMVRHGWPMNTESIETNLPFLNCYHTVCLDS